MSPFLYLLGEDPDSDGIDDKLADDIDLVDKLKAEELVRRSEGCPDPELLTRSGVLGADCNCN